MRGLGLLLFLLACSGGPLEDVGARTGTATVCAAGEQIDGVDVSYFDGTIDWPAVANAGKRFAVIRTSDGSTFVDPQFARNWPAARAAAVVRAPYQFFRAAEDPIAQAELLIAEVAAAGGFEAGDLQPVMDLETDDNQPTEAVLKNAQAWLDHVQQSTG